MIVPLLTEKVIFCSLCAKVSLPICTMIPLVYSAMRLGLLWSWVSISAPIGGAGRVLAIISLVYHLLDTFGFLLPVATLRYMRAHFFCVEASEVAVRDGAEDAVGLLPTV